MASEVSQNGSTEANNGLKRIEDIKSLDELDFEKLDLVVGDTPTDIKEQCLQLCKEYLAGNWFQQTLDTIDVKRVSGGLTNQLYCCSVKKPCDDPNVPQEVAVRLYGPKMMMKCDSEANERLTDVVISLMVSQNKLGPKVYGLFPTGQIQRYYKHRQFTPEEQKDPKLVTEVFQKLARIHAMDVPIKKQGNWLFTELDLFSEWMVENNGNKLFAEYNCEKLLAFDFAAEMAYIKGLALSANSPIVFTHNDYRSSNLMITETGEHDIDGRIVVCDFEYSCYGFRGMDFMQLSREWGRKQWDIMTVDGLPQEDSVMKPLIEIYVKECERIHGKQYSTNECNSVEHITREIKLFTLIGQFFMTIMSLKTITAPAYEKMDKKMMIQFGELSLNNYLIIKDRINALNLL